MKKALTCKQNWVSKDFINLCEVGFNISTCKVDFLTISVKCCDLARFKKAFRVKIRELIKTKEINDLDKYINRFYNLAIFVEYIYGHHSCASKVEFWQEELALSLQKTFQDEKSKYKKGIHIKYNNLNFYEEFFRKQNNEINPKKDTKNLKFIQNEKPFLNLKDYSHFEKFG